jgi:lysophospholipase L1-like esterase
MRYVVIGDSIPRGFRLGPPTNLHRRDGDRALYGVPLGWFDRPDRAYPALVAGALRARGIPVDLDDTLAHSGAPSGAVWRDGPSEALRRTMARPADLVTVTIGGNDVITQWFPYLWALWPARMVGAALPRAADAALERLAPPPGRALTAARRMGRRLGGLLGWLADGRARRLLVTTYFPLDAREVVVSRFTRPVNDAIREAARGVPGAEIVDLEPVFLGRDSHAPRGRRLIMLRDGVHPNARGHRAIAAEVLARLEGGAPG